jgi:uncharacterized protein YndB with AHSA1/START domain
MTIVLTILMIIGIIISVILITVLILPKKYKVLREVTIQQPQQKVFDYIKYIRNQDGFSVWANTDPNMKKTYKGDDGRVGFVSAWESDNKKVGAGEQEIIRVDEGKGIVTALRFFKPFPGEAVAQFMTAPGENNSTKVSWQLDSAMKYPMNFMLLFINMDKMLGADMEKGLENLKNKLAE